MRIGDIARRGRRVRVAEQFLGDPDVVTLRVDLSGEPVPSSVRRGVDAEVPQVPADRDAHGVRQVTAAPGADEEAGRVWTRDAIEKWAKATGRA